MEYIVENKDSFRVVGESISMSVEDSKIGITRFWEEVNNNGAIDKIHEVKSGEATNTHGRIIGVWRINDADKDTLMYTIGTEYIQGSSIYPLKIVEVAKAKWLIFKCQGKAPEALTEAYHQIFDQVLPQLDYKISTNMILEVYNIDDANKEEIGRAHV